MPLESPVKICLRDGCGKVVLARGLCRPHYRRMMKGLPGEPREKAAPGRGLNFLTGLIATQEAGCIKWPFRSSTKGYGRIMFGGKLTNASRAMCVLAHGAPPDQSLEAAHSCGKGHMGCVNPNHLSWKTGAGNEMDKHDHGTVMRGNRNHKTVLTVPEVKAIKEALSQGQTAYSLACRFGVAPGTVGSIATKRSWSYI